MVVIPESTSLFKQAVQWSDLKMHEKVTVIENINPLM